MLTHWMHTFITIFQNSKKLFKSCWCFWDDPKQKSICQDQTVSIIENASPNNTLRKWWLILRSMSSRDKVQNLFKPSTKLTNCLKDVSIFILSWKNWRIGCGKVQLLAIRFAHYRKTDLLGQNTMQRCQNWGLWSKSEGQEWKRRWNCKILRRIG